MNFHLPQRFGIMHETYRRTKRIITEHHVYNRSNSLFFLYLQIRIVALDFWFGNLEVLQSREQLLRI